MTMPMPKTKSMSGVQRGRLPRATHQGQDPDDAIRPVPIVRTLVGDRAGAVPSEAYQYDLVFERFAADEDFKKYWKIPHRGYARCSMEESISQRNSYIRVVMDLEPECKLYPTAYTPGFATVPRDISDSELRRATAMSSAHQLIPGLPEGYSVALDVYILKDAAVLLKHQRAFRGRVDDAYRWLDAIVNPGAKQQELENGGLALLDEVASKDGNNLQEALGDHLARNISAGPSMGSAKHWTWHSTHLKAEAPRPGWHPVGDGMALTNGGYGGKDSNVMQPSARETLPLSCLDACPRGLASDTSLDANAQRRQACRREIHMENALINAFGDHVGLPQRDNGCSWTTDRDDGAIASRKQNFKEETERLDRALEDIWARTVENDVMPDEDVTHI